MKPEEVYENLKQLAERLDITVSEENLKRTGIKVKSGFCRVKGKSLFIMDKKIKIRRKVDILAEFISTLSIEDFYVLPSVRELLDQYSKKIGTDKNADTEEDLGASDRAI